MAGKEDTNLAWTEAGTLAALIRARRLSPVELMESTLARIARLEPRLNGFAYLDAEAAMAGARAAEAEVMRGGPLGPLHGIPVTIKDLANTQAMPTQFGSPIMEGNRPAENSAFVDRLEKAGAIVVGKTTTSEFGWKGVSQSPLTGITHNPWGHGLNAGASSAGAGALTAAGCGPLHQGSDGAGSIRMPAHFCGVVGLKPSFGRVPVVPVSSADFTSHNGPLARTVADAALMLDVMAGPDAGDYTSLPALAAPTAASLDGGIKGARIAFSPDLGHARVDPEVAALVAASVAKLAADCGAVVEAATTPWAADGPALARSMWPAHLARLAPRLPEFESRMDPGLVACIRTGAAVSITEYQLIRDRKIAYIAAIHRWFEDWDFLVTPSVSVAAFPAERLMPEDWPDHEWDWLSWAEFSYPFNMSWNPAISVPCGWTADGRPVGMQIVGRRWDDAGVLRAASAFEAVAPWSARRPAVDD